MTTFTGGAGADVANSVTGVIVGFSGGSLAILRDTVGDFFVGNDGADQITAGPGADFMSGGGGIDSLDGGDGRDTISYFDKTLAVQLTLNGVNEATVKVGLVDEDKVRNVENVDGGSAGDTLVGDALANRFKGAVGADFLDGQGGVDTVDLSDKTAALANRVCRRRRGRHDRQL